MKRILVTGGTGVLGRELVARFRRAGYPVRALARRLPTGACEGIEWVRADLETGEGLLQAVSGVDVIVHAASSPFRRTRAVDVEGTGRLLEAASAAGDAHFLYVSIAGVDRVPLLYYRCKLAAEQLVEQAGIPWTIQRITQFHTLIDRLLRAACLGPAVLLPAGFRFHPMAPAEAADRLCELAAGAPAGRAPDIGGPEISSLEDLAREWLDVRGLRRPVLSIPLPGRVAAGFRAGLTTAPEGRVGRMTFREWLATQAGYSGG
jgi:uncharacterized protein YbjT (DUF2867 family)